MSSRRAVPPDGISELRCVAQQSVD